MTFLEYAPYFYHHMICIYDFRTNVLFLSKYSATNGNIMYTWNDPVTNETQSNSPLSDITDQSSLYNGMYVNIWNIATLRTQTEPISCSNLHYIKMNVSRKSLISTIFAILNKIKLAFTFLLRQDFFSKRPPQLICCFQKHSTF